MDDAKFIGSFLAIMLIVMYIGASIGLRLEFPGVQAKIEQLRSDVKKTTKGSDEDVIGQATEWNQRIASRQRYNQIWWSDPVWPDGWNDIQLIKIPER